MEEERTSQVQSHIINGRSDDSSPNHHRNNTSRLSSLLSSAERDFLLSPSGHQVRISDLEGTTVGLYFAANWYPQCRTFTNLLIQTYNDINSSAEVFEVIFVSSDEDRAAFSSFRSAMPWLSLPFSDLPIKKSLSHLFHIEAIPSLVILLPSGDGVIRDGVELIYRFGAEAFPFTMERIEELNRRESERHKTQTLVNLLTNHDRDYVLAHPFSTKVPVTSLVGKTVGLYFSAQWCQPCTRFTPRLVAIYHKIKQSLDQHWNSQNTLGEGQEQEDFEIVFASSDRDECCFEAYFNTMPFLAIPNGDASIKALVKHFDVRDIPCLIILGPDGKTVTKQGRNLINLYGESAYPFTRHRIEALEGEIDEASQSLPRTVRHVGHTRHDLILVSEGSGGGPFICCVCDEQGAGWAYLCLECGYEVHPRCIRTVGDHDGSTATVDNDNED